MKLLTRIITIALIGAFTATPLLANQAGDDSARHYKSNPDQYDGEIVDVDCSFVTRVNGGPQVDGVVFFLAHTVDDDNKAAGGSIIVAVLETDVAAFMRKYGTAMEGRYGKGGKVDTKRLRGTFHQLEAGRVYMDESGEAHALILAHREATGKNPLPTPSVGGKKVK